MSALSIVVLYTNIDLKLQNILHGPVITKWTRVLLCFNNMTLYISKSTDRVMNSRVSGQYSHTLKNSIGFLSRYDCFAQVSEFISTIPYK